ncbi:hypothetical protein JCM11491_002008, partial [Sporobolomyces phaffii]
SRSWDSSPFAPASLVGITIAGTLVAQGLVGTLVWLAILARRGYLARRPRPTSRRFLQSAERRLAREGGAGAGAGETTYDTTHCRSSFVEQWLATEAAAAAAPSAAYTPVDLADDDEARQSRGGGAARVADPSSRDSSFPLFLQLFPPPAGDIFIIIVCVES